MKIRSTARLAFPLASAIAALLVGGASSIHAASLTWDANNTAAGQTNGAGAWLASNQWWDTATETNQDWVSGSDAVFGGPATAGGAVTLASPTTVESFTFNPFTGTYTLGTAAQAITLNTGITKNTGSAAASFVSPITLGGAQTWTNNSTGTLTTANGTNLIDNGGFQLTTDGTGNFTFGVINNDAASITGAGDLVKNGTGTVSLGGVNAAFTGNVTVNGGVLRVTKPPSITGNLNLAGGVYEHYWSDAYTRTLGTAAGEVQITGGVSGFSENGATGVTFTLNNSAAFELVWGDALFNPSTLVLQADSAQGTSSLTLTNKLDLNGSDRTIRVSGGTTGAARATISGQIRTSSGTAGLTKNGAGYLALSNASNAWNGNTVINGGILDLAGMTNVNLGAGVGVRDITVAAGAAVRFNALSNAFLNRIVETASEIGVMTGTTANNLDFSSSTGANLPNAFLGNWAGNGAKMTYTGILTPASDNYRLGAKGSSGLLGISGTNMLTGTQGLIVGQTGASGIRVNLAGAQDFTGDTVINTGSRLTVGNNLALQNSVLDVGTAGGNFSLAAGTNAGRITGETAAPSPTFGGLKGSRNLLAVFSASGGNNETNLAATAVTGFTLNPGTGKTCEYSGVIADFGPATTLTKTGEGVQILQGTQTYTGATTVSGGTLGLGVTGSIATSAAVILGAGGTIDTSGQASYAIPASQPLTFGIDPAGSGSSGRIMADGLDITNAAVTLNVTEPLDDAVYVLANYLSLTGTAFGSVTGLPSGYTLDYAYQGNKIALVSGGASPYAAWSGGAAADIDTNGDGVDNGVAWALGAADPNANAIGLVPTLDNTTDPTYATFTFNRSDLAEADANTAITVQYGTDLVTWTTAVDDNDNVEIEVTGGSPTDTVVVKLKRSTLASGGKLFARLNVVVTP
jgi:autotransporter-associated beta strand protein